MIATTRLLPTTEQAATLLATMERINAACDWLAGEAFVARTASKYTLQHRYYAEMRSRFGLSAQMTVRAISKVCEAYKRDKSRRVRFRPHGAVAYDQRNMSFKAADRVSLCVLPEGRAVMPYLSGKYFHARMECARGQADLVLRRNKWMLYVTVDVPGGTPIKTSSALGVDLGIRNIAVDSDGEFYSGEGVEANRQRMLRLRTALQACGTRSAKRHLRKLSGKEARFRRHENHVISKHLVAKAKDTARALAIEELKGIRKRTTVRKSQRAMHAGWSFNQLRQFLSYKTALAGIPLVVVDARHTSQTCPTCGHCERANRRSQAKFQCKSCSFSAHADLVGALNVARRAEVMPPIVSVEAISFGFHQMQESPRL